SRRSLRLPNKLMVVIGGSRGIGAAVARLAAERGWLVLLTYSSRADDAAQVLSAIEAEGGKAHSYRCDVSREEDIIAVFEAAADLGRVAAVVYSSGITGPASTLLDASAETLREVIDVNLTGAMLCAREAVRAMAGSGGSITFISSRAADRGSSGEYVWYAASKGGLNSL